MKIRIRIFLAILVTVGIGFTLLVKWYSDDLKPQFRASTEEPLVDTAWLLATMASTHVQNGVIDPAFFRTALGATPKKITPAAIYDFRKTSMDLRIYVTDATGRVIFDSAGRDEGADYASWNDVVLTLQGKYGTRTTSDPAIPQDASIMYVAAPIKSGAEIVGVISVGKPTRNVNLFVEKARQKLILGGIITFTAVFLTTLVASARITRPIERLTLYAREVGLGRRQPLPRLGGGEIGELGKSFEEMRLALEGKQYVENYVQTLTHEMKSPIAAIQGAAELLQEEMPAERREQFLANIATEANRMQHLIERLLLLSSIEARQSLREIKEIDLSELTSKVAASLAPACMAKGISIGIEGDRHVTVRGEHFLIEQAVMNLLQNALDFSPTGSIIRTTIDRGEQRFRLIVEDQGPGIPDYALPRVFERFYSLNRPDTGKKSSGLGLSLVQEAMSLHGGNALLENLANGGTRATLLFPA